MKPDLIDRIRAEVRARLRPQIAAAQFCNFQKASRRNKILEAWRHRNYQYTSYPNASKIEDKLIEFKNWVWRRA